MSLLDPLFSATAARRIFEDRARLQRMLDFEAALARAEATTGVIPGTAAVAIGGQCRGDRFDFDALSAGAALEGNLAIPLVRHLTKLVREAEPDAAGYVHWGATSQDVIDTGLILQVRDALDLVDRKLIELCDALAELINRFRHTLLAGRTLLQQAVPVTFGLKLAGYLDAILRHRCRLAELQPRVLTLQFGGAAGTLAALGEQGISTSKELGSELGLTSPATPWHSHRDRMAEVGGFHALLAGTLGKIARDMSLQMQSEVGELFESTRPGRGGSSTMPQKRNPVGAAVVLAAAMRVPGLASTMYSAMVQEHERGLGGWHAEWETLPEICLITCGALEQLSAILRDPEVSPDAMLRNMHAGDGLIVAEAVSMALAKKIGKADAHALLEAASRSAFEERQPLLSILNRDQRIMQHFSQERLKSLLDPAQYTGSSQQIIDQVLTDYGVALLNNARRNRDGVH